MRWSNIKLILGREIRDQLRDRRTMFMIVVLPVLLYPLLGMAVLQVSQFRREKPTRVLVYGVENLPESPRLIEDKQFAQNLFASPEQAKSLELEFVPRAQHPASGSHGTPHDATHEDARRAIREGRCHAAVCFPDDFGKRLDSIRREIRKGNVDPKVPQPVFIYSSANEKSQLSYLRLLDVWQRWRQDLIRWTLRAANLPDVAAQPVEAATVDVADQEGRRGSASWPRILPLLLMIWAMTGAFYPAVDLCAGEKERGTMETLLSSPAERGEIVLGKLLTIMLFSSVTALLNIVSIGLVGWMAMSKIPGFGPPPLSAALWLVPALPLVSALFGAPCLALAAFARSTKEGQYYLMPLLMGTMPLAVLPVASGMELNLGSSLIPVTGMMLVLRSAMEGQYWPVVQYLPPVLLVTFGVCFLTIRWAVDQFNSEGILFRESERLNLTLWAKYLFRDRRAVPRLGAALSCGVVILLGRFLASFMTPVPGGFREFAIDMTVTHLLIVIAPTILMTFALARSPRETLLLKRPNAAALGIALLLPLALHPTLNLLRSFVMWLYPLSEEVTRSVGGLESLFTEAPLAGLIFVLALLPAVGEELAFRGFLLSGFRQTGHTWRAIILASLFFGFTHSILQQSIIAAIVGVLIGFIAVRTNSIFPAMAFHFVNNAMAAVTLRVATYSVPDEPTPLNQAVRSLQTTLSAIQEPGSVAQWTAAGIGLLVAAVLVALLIFVTRRRSDATPPTIPRDPVG